MKQVAAERCMVLLVEDSRNDAALALHALREAGFSECVRVATDGKEALDFLFGEDGAENRSALRLILLDVKLPRVGGVEVLERVKADPETRTIPVVMLTSSGELRDRSTCFALGANSYVVKPSDYSSFRRKVVETVSYWLRLSAGPPLPGERSTRLDDREKEA